MENEQLKKVYYDLWERLRDFQVTTGGSTIKKREIERKNRDEIVVKVQEILEKYDETVQILYTCASYHHSEQHFFEDKFFSQYMSEFLHKMNEKYKFDGFKMY